MAISWLTLAAQAYLAVVMFAGMAAGEEPARAWGLGTLGVLVDPCRSASGAIANAAVYVLATPGTDFTVWSWISLIWTVLFVVATSCCWPPSRAGYRPDPTRTGPRPSGDGLGPVDRQRGREVAQEVEPLVDLLGRRVRTGHQEARPAGHRDAGQLAPALRRAAGPPRSRLRACR